MMKQALGSTGCNRPGAVPRLVLLCALALCAGRYTSLAAAAEVYTWTDENGIVHYSQTPNDGGQSEEIDAGEIYRPGSEDAYAKPVPQEDATPAEPTEAAESEDEAPLSIADQKRAELAERREQRREEQAETRQLCSVHQRRLEQLEPARRVFYSDDQGNEVRMDDDQRVALIEESEAFVAANCRD